MPTTGNFLSPSIVKIEMLFDGVVLSTASTGFFVKLDEQWFLLTNWHVLAGSHPDTGQPLGRGIPNQCRFYSVDILGEKMAWRAYTYQLGDASVGETVWFQHPIAGQSIDVAALPVSTETIGRAKNLLDPGGHDPEMWVDLGADLFLPGYPMGVGGNGMFAIWKRGSLATSLEFGEGMDRYVLVDTATREGMSGAPCIVMPRQDYYHIDLQGGGAKRINGTLRWRWLGVYSGRLNPSCGLEAQLGKVWRTERAIEVMRGRVPGKISLRNPSIR